MEAFDQIIVDIYGSSQAESPSTTHQLLRRLLTLTKVILDNNGSDDDDFDSQRANALDLSHTLSNIFTVTSTNYFEIYQQYKPHYDTILQYLCKLCNVQDSLTFLSRLRDKKSRHDISNSVAEQLLLDVVDPFSSIQPHALWMQLLGSSHHVVAARCLLVHAYAHREHLVRKYAYSVPSPSGLDLILSQQCSTIISLGCGKAYWSHCLRQAALPSSSSSPCFIVPADVIVHENPATDGKQNFCQDVVQVHPLDQQNLWCHVNDADSAALLLCWVPKTGDDGFVSALETFPGKILLLVGEQSVGSACGSANFWSVIDRLWEEKESICLSRFIGWYDSVSVYTRREKEVKKEEVEKNEEEVDSLPPRYLSDMLPTHLLDCVLLYANAHQLVDIQRVCKKMRLHADMIFRSPRWRCKQLRGRRWSWDSSTDQDVQRGVTVPPRGVGTCARLTASIESINDTTVSCESCRLFAKFIVEEELVDGHVAFVNSSDGMNFFGDDDDSDNDDSGTGNDPYAHGQKWRGKYCGNVIWGPDKKTSAVFEDDDENIFQTFSFHVRLTKVERLGVAKRHRSSIKVSEDLLCFIDYDGELHACVPFDADNGSVPVVLNWSLGVESIASHPTSPPSFPFKFEWEEEEEEEEVVIEVKEVEEVEEEEDSWATLDSWKAAGMGEKEFDDNEEDSWANFDDA